MNRLAALRGTSLVVRAPDVRAPGDTVLFTRYTAGDVAKPIESAMAWDEAASSWTYTVSDGETRASPAGTYPGVAVRDRGGVKTAIAEYTIELRPSVIAGDAPSDARTHNERVLAALEDGLEKLARSGAAVNVSADGFAQSFEDRRELSALVNRYRLAVAKERGNGGIKTITLCD